MGQVRHVENQGRVPLMGKPESRIPAQRSQQGAVQRQNLGLEHPAQKSVHLIRRSKPARVHDKGKKRPGGREQSSVRPSRSGGGTQASTRGREHLFRTAHSARTGPAPVARLQPPPRLPSEALQFSYLLHYERWVTMCPSVSSASETTDGQETSILLY